MTQSHESAFPEVQPIPQFNDHTYGLTKREYFAALSLQGLCSSPYFGQHSEEYHANTAVYLADSLIEALNK